VTCLASASAAASAWTRTRDFRSSTGLANTTATNTKDTTNNHATGTRIFNEKNTKEKEEEKGQEEEEEEEEEMRTNVLKRCPRSRKRKDDE